MSAEIPGMVSPEEIEAANAAVIIERDALASVLKELQAENAKLRTTLQASTELLRKSLPPVGKDTTRLYGPVEQQIAANEAALKKAAGE